MKIFGKKIQGPNEEIIVIPREGGDIILKAVAIMNYERFDNLVPKPTPPMIRKKGQTVNAPDFDNANYKLAISQYGNKKYHYMIIESLKDSPGLEWETVDINNPDTWGNFQKELEEAGFNDREIQMIQRGVLIANTVDESKVEEARQRFLQLQEDQRLAELYPKDELKNTQSGEPANASA